MLVDGPHFQATDEGELVFLLSDGDSSRRPTEHDILEPEDEDGTLRQNYYVRVPLDHADSHRWREEIAKYLAPLVLGSTYTSSHTKSPYPRLTDPRFPSHTRVFLHLHLPRLPCNPQRKRASGAAPIMRQNIRYA
jgi:hypothetical protein